MVLKKLLVLKTFFAVNFILCGFCFSQTDHFVFKDNTGDSYSIVVDSIFLDGQIFIPGEEDEIGVFTSDGLCVGASILDDSLPLPIVAWEDDPLTAEPDGYTLGDTMHFRFWNSSEEIEMDAEPLYKLGDGTFGFNLYSQLNLNVSASAVEDFSEEVSFPYILTQNYPNPFNQATKIEFALAKSGFVSLNIYDLLGRKVRTLVSEQVSSGYKSVLWDGKDNFGDDVASGIYFYQIKVGGFTETKKLVLLK